MKFYIKLSIALVVMTSFFNCTKEYQNPNAATKDEVLKSPDGLMGLVVGLRTQWSVGGASTLFSQVVCNGLSTGELTVLNTGNAALASLEAGKGSLNGANSTMANLWTGANLAKANAQLLIDNAGNIGDTGTKSGVLAYGYFFKALAIGTMAQYWEQVSAEVISSSEYIGGKRPGFITRAAALDQAVSLLRQAEATLATPPSAVFNTRVGADFDLASSIQAMIARFSMMNGKYSDASAAAAKAAAATALSRFRFDAVNQNPIFRSGFVSNNVIGGVDKFGLKGSLLPDSADARIPFYLGGTTLSKATGFYKSDTDVIPLFLPSEMTLIIAEVLARDNKIAEAITELNKVLTKTTDPYNVTAKLKPYAGAETKDAVLTEIFRQRCIELYLSGLKLDDSRRFGRPGPLDTGAERNRNFYPYPNAERDNNPNTPKDPDV
jgi:starch-binding outer membrane protein, SusD/RagB family